MKKYRLVTSGCSYIAEQLDENNYVLRLEDEFSESIGTIPADIIESSIEWIRDEDIVSRDSLAEVFALLNPNKL